MTDRELLHAAIGALRNTVLAAYERLHPEIVVVRP
jgi:hypothetical protein